MADLEQIISFCRSIQSRFNRDYSQDQKLRSTLIDFCRHCGDASCPDSCEVKKAFTAIYESREKE